MQDFNLNHGLNNNSTNFLGLEHGDLILGRPDIFSKIRRQGVRFASLPELMKIYLKNSSFFDETNSSHELKLYTDSNEILGRDLEGRMYDKSEKLIVHTHGVYIKSLDNHAKSSENSHLSEKEFANLITGLTPHGEKVRVYKEEELNFRNRKEYDVPCITIIHADKYFKDPSYYCSDLEYIHFSIEFKKNSLLVSRTLQNPLTMMQFIKEHVPYFIQINPLVEPLMLNKPEKSFEKYALRVMPLILGDGEITKEAPDKINILEENIHNTSNKNNSLAALFPYRD